MGEASKNKTEFQYDYFITKLNQISSIKTFCQEKLLGFEKNVKNPIKPTDEILKINI